MRWQCSTDKGTTPLFATVGVDPTVPGTDKIQIQVLIERQSHGIWPQGVFQKIRSRGSQMMAFSLKLQAAQAFKDQSHPHHTSYIYIPKDACSADAFKISWIWYGSLTLLIKLAVFFDPGAQKSIFTFKCDWCSGLNELEDRKWWAVANPMGY